MFPYKHVSFHFIILFSSSRLFFSSVDIIPCDSLNQRYKKSCWCLCVCLHTVCAHVHLSARLGHNKRHLQIAHMGKTITDPPTHTSQSSWTHFTPDAGGLCVPRSIPQTQMGPWTPGRASDRGLSWLLVRRGRLILWVCKQFWQAGNPQICYCCTLWGFRKFKSYRFNFNLVWAQIFFFMNFLLKRSYWRAWLYIFLLFYRYIVLSIVLNIILSVYKV